MKICVFAGSFDPFTVGHQEVVDKCLEMFDGVIIAVLNNPDKNPMFSVEKRIEFINALYGDDDRVSIKAWNGLLVDFMRENGVKINVRGVRNADDYKYENNMTYFNTDMYPELITVYLPSKLSLSHVSSSAIRSLITSGGDAKGYIPEKIYSLIK